MSQNMSSAAVVIGPLLGLKQTLSRIIVNIYLSVLLNIYWTAHNILVLFTYGPRREKTYLTTQAQTSLRIRAD